MSSKSKLSSSIFRHFANAPDVESKCKKTKIRQKVANLNKKKQTILTSEHRHTNNTTNRQRVSRHSLPTLLYFLFFPPHIFLIQISEAIHELRLKINRQVSNFMPTRKWHIDFCPNRTSRHTSKIQRVIFCPRTKDR